MMFLEKELERRRIIIEELRKKNEDLHEEIALRNKENDALKLDREEYLPIDWCIREGKSGIPKAFSLKDTTGQTLGDYISRLKSNSDTHLDLLKKQQAKCKELQTKLDEYKNSYGVVYREDNKPTEFKVDDCLYRFNSSNDMAFAIMRFHIDLKETKEKLRESQSILKECKGLAEYWQSMCSGRIRSKQ